MSENPKSESHDVGALAEKPTAVAPAAAEALKAAPQAVRRSMPMALSITLGILLAGLIGWLAHYLVFLMLILYLSFVAATIMDAPVQWLRRSGIRRGFAAVLVMLGSLALVLGILFVLTNGLYGQVSAVSSNLEKAPARINEFVNGLKHHFPALEQKTGDFDVAAQFAKAIPEISTLWANALTGVEVISWLIIMFFLVLYMLVDGVDHMRAARGLLPRHMRLQATHFFNDLAKAHRGWAVASLSNVCSATALIGFGLFLIGIPGSFLLGFVAGLGELIPNIGPILGATPALLFTLLIEPDKFFYVFGMFIVAQTIQSYTISPMMLRFSIELPVLVTIISVLVFGILFGFLGILVAIPLVADMVVLWQFINRYLEKDTTDYDTVNREAIGHRTPVSSIDTSPSRLRQIFRSSRKHRDAPDTRSPAPTAAGGLARLDQAERRAAVPNPPTV